MSARFTQNTHVNAIRAELIDDDLDNLTAEQIDAIACACWANFEPIARRYLVARYANDHDVWDEATDRGYFTADHDD
jgi:hypothetical protein